MHIIISRSQSTNMLLSLKICEENFLLTPIPSPLSKQNQMPQWNSTLSMPAPQKGLSYFSIWKTTRKLTVGIIKKYSVKSSTLIAVAMGPIQTNDLMNPNQTKEKFGLVWIINSVWI